MNCLLLLRGARAVLPNHIAEDASIVIENGRIAKIFESAVADDSPFASVVDCTGLSLYPGFIDVHIHGAVGVDTMEANASDLGRVSQFLATRGVTGWLPTLVPAPNADYARSINAIEDAMKESDGAQKSNGGARILGVHYEGPFVNSS